MSQASEEFTSKLTTLVCLNLPNATSMTPADKELGAAMLTQLAKQLGFIVAGVCHGDQQQMLRVLECWRGRQLAQVGQLPSL